MGNGILPAALAYAAARYAVIPQSRGKVPLTKLRPEDDNHGFRDATASADLIRRWWHRWPRANVAIATGPISRIFVLDIDGDQGRQALNGLVEEHGPLPRTPASITSKGYHLVFAWPADGREPRNRVGKVGAGLDIRADGAGFAAPPSVHRSGHVYRWAAGRSIFDIPAPPAPDWLIAAACRLPEPKRPVATAHPPVDDSWGPAPAYARAALDSAARAIAGAPPGQQEATLNTECFTIGQLVAGGVMPASFARHVLCWAGSKMTTGDPRRPWQPHEIAEKVDRAFADATRAPRAAPERQARHVR